MMTAYALRCYKRHLLRWSLTYI